MHNVAKMFIEVPCFRNGLMLGIYIYFFYNPCFSENLRSYIILTLRLAVCFIFN